jgi:translation elongation factor P/translation initiation factor 5A
MMQTLMLVKPHQILKGDLIDHAGAIVRVTHIETTPTGNHKFFVTYQANGDMTYYYFRPTDLVALLSI